MQDKIFEVTHKSVKSVKVFSLEIFRLYGNVRVTTMGTIQFSVACVLHDNVAS